MNPKLIASIRTFLEMNQEELAHEIGTSKTTLVRIEGGGSMKPDLERSLISFLKSQRIEVYEAGFQQIDDMRETLYGSEGFHIMYQQLYTSIRQGNGDLWLYNGVSHLVADGLGQDFIKTHQQIMNDMSGRFGWRVVVEEGDDAFWGHKYAYYKWIPKKHFNNKTIYVYGNTVAIVDFEDGIRINLTHSKDVTDTMRLFLETTWEAKAYDPDTEKPFRPE
jgi:DNA-binding XRE family transcriptional regulator